MRVFKRPMFRKGGEAMTGIMENVSPRQNLSNGTEFEKAMATVDEVLGPVQKNDPLTDFLLLYGPALAKSNLPGGTIRNLIGAADDPLKQTLASRRAQRERERSRKLTALQLAEAEKDRQLKRDIASEKSGMNLLPTFVDVYDGDLTLATNRNTYETQGLKTKGMNTFGEKFKGLVGGDQHGDINSKAFLNKKNLGNVYYDITDNKYKRIRRTTEGFGVEVIDINTFSPEADEAAIAPKESYTGEFSDNPAYRRPPKLGFTIKEKEAFDIDDPSA